MAWAALARRQGYRAGHARDGVLAARSTANHRSQPGYPTAQSYIGLRAWHVGGSGLQEAQVL